MKASRKVTPSTQKNFLLRGANLVVVRELCSIGCYRYLLNSRARALQHEETTEMCNMLDEVTMAVRLQIGQMALWTLEASGLSM